MNTIGWVLILMALLLGRGVYKGRVLQIGEDLSDSFLALLNGDAKKLQEVLNRTGDSNTPSATDLSLFTPTFDLATGAAGGVAQGLDRGLNQLENRLGASLGLAAMILGEKAKGYRWGASGPDYYDCSGLMWKAMVGAKIYTGKRFTTSSFVSMTKSVYTRVDSPMVDDVVLWLPKLRHPTGHMGVVTGADKFYSARSVSSGIGETKISTFRTDKPAYYRRTSFPHPDGR